MAEQTSSRDRNRTRLRRSGKMQNIPDDAVQALDLLVNDCGIFVFGGASDEGSFQTVQAHVDGGERISDFMGHARGKRPKGGQLLLPLDDGAAFNKLCA